ncbi:MAG: hypothetical protein WCR74_17670 [Betaproteobacteria bacterium]
MIRYEMETRDAFALPLRCSDIRKKIRVVCLRLVLHRQHKRVACVTACHRDGAARERIEAFAVPLFHVRCHTHFFLLYPISLAVPLLAAHVPVLLPRQNKLHSLVFYRDFFTQALKRKSRGARDWVISHKVLGQSGASIGANPPRKTAAI